MTDRQTDGRTDGIVVANTALRKQCGRAVITEFRCQHRTEGLGPLEPGACNI